MNSWDMSMSLIPASHVSVRSALCAAAMPGRLNNRTNGSVRIEVLLL
jgi:hypothetical protein